MSKTPRVIYAQSSDIRSRSYAEYRRDMKKKAIAELDFMPFLQDILVRRYNDPKIKVVKHGGDSELWFSSSGRVTQEPDYLMLKGERSFLYEFQYCEQIEGLTHFDFKVSKVGKKVKGVRLAHTDREFFYAVKPELKYAFVTPQWIMENGEIAPVPAWGSRPAYRVPREVFMRTLLPGGQNMERVVNSVNDKNTLLEFQNSFLELEAESLSRRLQEVIDEQKLMQVIPGNLQGFYEVCRLIDALGKSPDNPSVWLVYLASFFDAEMTSEQFAQFVFALDFLYFKCDEIRDNEKSVLSAIMPQAVRFAREYAQVDGLFCKNPRVSPMEETRRILFAINLLEDLTQDCIVNLGLPFDKIKNIFQTAPNISRMAKRIRDEL